MKKCIQSIVIKRIENIFKKFSMIQSIFFTLKVAKKLEAANDLTVRKLRKKVDEAKIQHDDILAQVCIRWSIG